MSEKISTQLRKGFLQGMILIILDQEPNYGYGLMKKISEAGLGVVPKGTVYPLLTNMLAKKLLKQGSPKDSGQRQRKYYFLTALGQKEKEHFIAEWQTINTSMQNILGREER